MIAADQILAVHGGEIEASRVSVALPAVSSRIVGMGRRVPHGSHCYVYSSTGRAHGQVEGGWGRHWSERVGLFRA